MYYWLCVGEKLSEVGKLNHYVLDNEPEQLLKRAEFYWQGWVNKEQPYFADLSPDIIDMYKRSLLTVKTQMDRRGAIIAANDTDILQFNRDHYSYMWPRDGALVALAMTKAGYDGTISSFFKFCSNALTKEGYLLHKYNPDGSAGSSWHPFINGGELQLPIQEDETALVLFSLWEYYVKSGQIEYCQELYASLIRPAAKFLQKYMYPDLGLPLPSYDLWEERRGIFTFTCASVYAGLIAAANFAELFGDELRYGRYSSAAQRIKEAMLLNLYDEESGRFLRGIYVSGNGEITKDYTVESSMFAVFSFRSASCRRSPGDADDGSNPGKTAGENRDWRLCPLRRRLLFQIFRRYGPGSGQSVDHFHPVGCGMGDRQSCDSGRPERSFRQIELGMQICPGKRHSSRTASSADGCARLGSAAYLVAFHIRLDCD